MIEPGLIAPLPKLVTKSCIREGPPEIVDQKREITDRRCVKNYLQGWQDREHQLVWLLVAAFMLSEYQFAAANMLPAKPNGVRSSLSGKQHQRQGEPRLQSERSPRIRVAVTQRKRKSGFYVFHVRFGT